MTRRFTCTVVLDIRSIVLLTLYLQFYLFTRSLDLMLTTLPSVHNFTCALQPHLCFTIPPMIYNHICAIYLTQAVNCDLNPLVEYA